MHLAKCLSGHKLLLRNCINVIAQSVHCMFTVLSLGRGAKNCTLREPCTEQDYYEIHTACDSEHKVCITNLSCAHEVFFTREIVRKDNNHSILNKLIVVASGACIC